MITFGRHVSFIVVLAALAIALVGCKQAGQETTGTLSISVSGMADAKTIAPEGDNEITHYRLGAANLDGSGSFSSGYLDRKAGTYVIEGLPFGTYSVTADGYELKDGSYIHIAKGEEEVVVRPSGTSDVHIILDELADTPSGDVMMVIILPMGVATPVTASVRLDDGDGTIIEGDVPINGGGPTGPAIILDADDLFGNGEVLPGGSWLLSGKLLDEGGGAVASFSEALNLRAGLAAEGTIIATPLGGAEEMSPYVKLVSQNGSGMVFLGGGEPEDSTVPISIMLQAGLSISGVQLDGTVVEPVIGMDESTGRVVVTVAGLEKDISTVTITSDDGSSLVLRVYDLTDSPVIPGVLP